MSKNTVNNNKVNKAHIQQSLARKIWGQVKRRFQKPTEHPINNASIMAIQQDLALIDDEKDEMLGAKPDTTVTTVPENTAKTSQESTEFFEMEITLDGLNQLINTLKQSEKTLKNPQDVVVEFIPLPSPMNTPVHTKRIYREIQIESMSDKIKKEKEQRELAKRITHYPPSDRLH